MGCGASKSADPGSKTKWDALNQRIPYQANDNKIKTRRDTLWTLMDRRKANNLTEDDCLEGCKAHLDLYPLCGEANTKMANKAAWNASHLLRKEPDATENVDPSEFRIYLQYLREYLELADMFAQMDTDGAKNNNGERSLTLAEFKNAQPMLKNWGAKITDPDKTFKEIDKSNTGKLSFPEFCVWAEKNQLDREKADRLAAEARAGEAKERSERMKLLAELSKRLPQGSSPEDRDRRHKLFDKFDEKKTGKLTEADCLAGCKKHLELNKLSKDAELAMVNKSAFNRAKNVMQAKADKDVDTVDKHEFRFYLITLRNHYELSAIFNELDSSDDKKITREEFKKALPKLQKYGADVKPENADHTFDEIDTDHTGSIDYNQFVAWASRRDLDIEKADLEADDEYKAHRKALEEDTTAVNTRIDTEKTRQDAEAQEAERRRAEEEAARKAEEEARVKAAQQNEDTQEERERQALLQQNDDAQRGLPPDEAAAKAKADSEARSKLWQELKQLLPLDRTKVEFAKRDRLFHKFDENNGGTLTEAECLKGTREHLHLDQLTDDLGSINHRAFNAAKNLHPGDGGDDTVDRYEFRAYLSTLRNTFEINEMFNEVDKSGDRRLTRDEFKVVIPRLANWGVRVNDPDRAFDEIDAKKNGYIDFEEFCDFATKYNLDMEREDYQKLLEARRAAEADAQRGEMTEEEKAAAREEANRRRVLWDDLKLRLPRQKNQTENEQRTELFKQFDTAGNGHIDYDEFEAGARSILKLHEFVEPLAPILTRAFDHAANARQEPGSDRPLIERIEFRIALVFIYDFLELFVKFEELEFTLDRRINFQMFEQICPTLEGWGIPLPDHAAAFEEVDEFGVGTVSFDEFADWAVFRHMQAQNVNVARRRSSGTNQ